MTKLNNISKTCNLCNCEVQTYTTMKYILYNKKNQTRLCRLREKLLNLPPKPQPIPNPHPMPKPAHSIIVSITSVEDKG